MNSSFPSSLSILDKLGGKFQETFWDKFSPEIQNLWNETQTSLTKGTMIPSDLNETFPEVSNSHYAFLGMLKNNRGLQDIIPTPYLLNVGIKPPFVFYDLAHEICHLYLHSVKKYPMIWDKMVDNHTIDFSAKIHNQRKVAARLHDVVVHPLLDEELRNRNIIDQGFYERMKEDAHRNLQKFSNKSIVDENDLQFKATFILDFLGRLDPRDITPIIDAYKDNANVKQILDEAHKMSKLIVRDTPESVKKSIEDLWKHCGYRIDRLELQILDACPFV